MDNKKPLTSGQKKMMAAQKWERIVAADRKRKAEEQAKTEENK